MDNLWLITLLAVGVAVGFGLALTVKSQPAGSVNLYKNSEVWEWIDYKGRKRSLTVRRNVSRNEG